MSAEETKIRILEAALHEFSTFGFQGARTSSIAKQAGVSRTMLHYHYSSKEALYEAIAAKVYTDGLQKLQMSLMAHSGEVKNVVEMMVHVTMDFLEERPDFIRFIINTSMQDPERMVNSTFGQNDQMLNMLEAVVSEAKKKHPELNDQLDAEHLLFNIMGMSIFPFLIRDYVKGHSKRSDAEMDALYKQRRSIIIDILNKQLF